MDAECFLLLPRLSRGLLTLLEAEECRLLRTRLRPTLSMVDPLIQAEAKAEVAGRAVSVTRVELTQLYLRLQQAALRLLNPGRPLTERTAGAATEHMATTRGDSDGAEEQRAGGYDARSCASYRELPASLQLMTVLAVLAFGTSGGYTSGAASQSTSEGNGQSHGSTALAALCEVYGIRWLCGISCSSPLTTQSLHDG